MKLPRSSLLPIALWILGGCALADGERSSAPTEASVASETASLSAEESETPAPAPSPEVASAPSETAPAETASSSEGGGTPARSAPGFAWLHEIERLHEEVAQALEVDASGRARKLVREILALDPVEPRAVVLEARFLRDDGQHDAALDLIRRARSRRRTSLPLLEEEVATLVASGDFPAAMTALGTARVGQSSTAQILFLQARVLALQGDRDRALETLEEAAGEGFRLVHRLREDDAFDPIRDDERFGKVVARAQFNLIEESRRQRERRSRSREEPLALAPDALRSELRHRLARGFGFPLDLEGTLADGSPLRSGDLRGTPHLVVAWAHWSTESVDHLAKALDVARAFREREGRGELGTLLVAVDIYEQGTFPEYTRKLLAERKIEAPCLILDAAAAQRFGLGTIPTTILLGEDGRQYLFVPGSLEGETLTSLAEILVAGPTAARIHLAETEARERPESDPSEREGDGNGDGE